FKYREVLFELTFTRQQWLGLLKCVQDYETVPDILRAERRCHGTFTTRCSRRTGASPRRTRTSRVASGKSARTSNHSSATCARRRRRQPSLQGYSPDSRPQSFFRNSGNGSERGPMTTLKGGPTAEVLLRGDPAQYVWCVRNATEMRLEEPETGQRRFV